MARPGGRRRDDATRKGAALASRAGEAWASFSTPQKVITALLAVGLVAGAVLASQALSRPALAPLYSDLASEDAAAMVEQLSASGVAYELTDGGTTILVPRDQVYDQRLAMSSAGLPQSSASGYALLDEQGVTASQFQQQVAFQRAMEGELSATIGAIEGVETAVVHLAIPEKDVFLDEETTPTASVLVDTAPGRELEDGQVASIVHLVSSSVEALPADSVTVVDAEGTLLSAPGLADSGSGDQLEATGEFEGALAADLQRLLDRIVGPGNAVAQVAADLTFDETEETSERFLTEEGVPPLTEETTREEYTGAGTATGGVLGPDNVAVPGAGAGGDTAYTKEQRTASNAVGKVTARTVRAPGTVERLSVSVVVDTATGGDVDVTALTEAVTAAAGLDTARGDTISVTRLPFDTSAATQAQEQLEAAAAAEGATRTRDLVRTAVLAALVVIVVVVTLVAGRRRRPTVDVLDVTALEESPGEAERLAALDAAIAAAPLRAERREALESAARAEQVAELVERQPDEVAALLRTWLADRRG